MYILTHAEIEAEIAYRLGLFAADPRPWDAPQLADINRVANEIQGLRSALASLAHFLAIGAGGRAGAEGEKAEGAVEWLLLNS